MKKILLVLVAALSLLFTSCINIDVPLLHKTADSSDVMDDDDDDDDDDGEVRIKAEYLKPHSICVSQSDTTAGKQRAIEAIKYSLSMYKPDLKYDNIRAVAINDGTYDVIIDYKQSYTHNILHNYYNVTLGEGDNFQINSINGDVGGWWSYN